MANARISPLGVVVKQADGSLRLLDWETWLAVGPPTGRARPRPSGLRATLTGLLAAGPRPIHDVKEALQGRWGPDAIRAVKRQIGVEAYMLDGEWMWRLPDER